MQRTRFLDLKDGIGWPVMQISDELQFVVRESFHPTYCTVGCYKGPHLSSMSLINKVQDWGAFPKGGIDGRAEVPDT
jgi:hypothetical protein